jgi:DNA repair exonuclease SbcCD ATPase subunit
MMDLTVLGAYTKKELAERIQELEQQLEERDIEEQECITKINELEQQVKDGYGLYKDEQQEVERLRSALEFAQGAIEDAIGLEDGLDGATGEAILKMIKHDGATGEAILKMIKQALGGNPEISD